MADLHPQLPDDLLLAMLYAFLIGVLLVPTYKELWATVKFIGVFLVQLICFTFGAFAFGVAWWLAVLCLVFAELGKWAMALWSALRMGAEDS